MKGFLQIGVTQCYARTFDSISDQKWRGVSRWEKAKANMGGDRDSSQKGTCPARKEAA
ncbi:hypothetical protein [Cupriavidus necator]